MFIYIEYSLQDTSILQWSTEDTILQIDTRSCLHPKADRLQELHTSRSGRLAKRSHIGRIRLAVPTRPL